MNDGSDNRTSMVQRENLLSKGKLKSDKPTEADLLQSSHQLNGKTTLNAVLP